MGEAQALLGQVRKWSVVLESSLISSGLTNYEFHFSQFQQWGRGVLFTVASGLVMMAIFRESKVSEGCLRSSFHTW